MCKTIYALLILIFIFIVLNWLKTRETFSSNCKYHSSTSNSQFEIIREIPKKTKEDIESECTRNPSCQYYDYIETTPAAGGEAATGIGLLRSCKKGTSDISNIKINQIKISIAGEDKILSLAEVEVLDKNDRTKNLIRPSGTSLGTANQKDTIHSGEALLAVNGKTDGKYWEGPGETNPQVTHTDKTTDPWWNFTWQKGNEINLLDIGEIKIYNRTGTTNEVKKRIDGAKVELLMDSKVIKTFPLLKHDPKKDVYDFPNIYQYKKECKTPKSNSNIFSDGIKRTEPVQREPKQANNMFGAVFNVRQRKSFLSSKLN